MHRSDSPGPLVTLCAAIVFALVQAALPNGQLSIDFATMFANGIAVAIYAPIIRAAGPAPRRLASCINLALLGITHFIWVTLAAALLTRAFTLLGLSGTRYENASMFFTTGLVFGTAIVLDLRTLQSAAIMLVATAASTGIDLADGLWRTLAPPHLIGLPAAPLHAGIALTLFLAARGEQLRHRPGLCASCGYDLRGLGSDVCPECGSRNEMAE